GYVGPAAKYVAQETAPALTLGSRAVGRGLAQGGRDGTDPTPCPHCGAATSDGARFCPECGKGVQAACPRCRAEVAGGAKFCEQCGAPMVRA
ncbi:MAG TPA: zinc ribbon domain-containing protein, partial [Candidatus Thermoplasmatota archaeon]|nr:zinc ribbon domain-containing protein [Candidatus Thermoplasmatota archaeon]